MRKFIEIHGSIIIIARIPPGENYCNTHKLCGVTNRTLYSPGGLSLKLFICALNNKKDDSTFFHNYANIFVKSIV